jgi:hypothetical protein
VQSNGGLIAFSRSGEEAQVAPQQQEGQYASISEFHPTGKVLPQLLLLCSSTVPSYRTLAKNLGSRQAVWSAALHNQQNATTISSIHEPLASSQLSAPLLFLYFPPKIDRTT